MHTNLKKLNIIQANNKHIHTIRVFSVGFLTFFQPMKYQHAVAVRELEFWLAKKKKTNKNIWLTTALDSSTDADIDVPKKKNKNKNKNKNITQRQASWNRYLFPE